MKINSIQSNSRSEVIVVTRKPAFTAGTTPCISQGLINRYGLDMTTRVGYSGEGRFRQAPKSLPREIRKIFRDMKINWASHVEEFSKK